MRERGLDLSLILLVQMTALGYGVYTLYMARPIAMVYEYSKFTVLRAVDSPGEQGVDFLRKISTRFKDIPIIGLRPFSSVEEDSRYTFEALVGAPLNTRQELWVEIDASDIATSGQSIDKLINRSDFCDKVCPVMLEIKKDGASSAKIHYLPITDRDHAWVAIFTVKSFRMFDLISLDPYSSEKK